MTYFLRSCFHIYIKKRILLLLFSPILSSFLTGSSQGAGLLSVINCMYVQCRCRQGFEMLGNICLFFHASGSLLSLGKRHKSPFTSHATKSGAIKKIEPWLIATIFFLLETKVIRDDLREGVISGGSKFDDRVSSAKKNLPLIL